MSIGAVGHKGGMLAWSSSARRLLETVAVSPRLSTLLLIVVYFSLLAVFPPGGQFIGDQGVKYLQVDAVANRGTLAVGSIDDVLSVFRPEFKSNFYVAVGNSYQSIFPPAYALVVAPFYWLLGVPGLILPSILGSLLAAYVGGLMGKVLQTRYPGGVVLIIGLASPLIFYAFVLWEHGLGVGVVTLAGYLALRARFVLAGLLYGIAIWFRPEIILFGPALAFALCAGWGLAVGLRRLAWFVVGALCTVSPWWTYNYLTFGSLFGPHATQEIPPEDAPLGHAGVILQHWLPLGQRRWAVLLLAVVVLYGVQLLWKRTLVPPRHLFWFGISAICLTNLGLLAQGIGISFTDVFPLAFAALLVTPLIGHNSSVRYLAVLTLGYVVGVTLLTPTWGGGGWGPRMLLAGYPFWILLSVIGFEASKDRVVKLAVILLLVWSLVFQIAGLRVLRDIQLQWRELNTTLVMLEPKVAATAVWWLPQVGAPTMRHMRWYGIVDEEDIDRLLELERCFWWFYQQEDHGDETSALPTRVLEQVAELSNSSLEPIERKHSLVRNLEATLYCSRMSPE